MIQAAEHTNPLAPPFQPVSLNIRNEPAANVSRLPIIDAARGGAALLVCALHARSIMWVGLGSCLSQRGHDPILFTILGVVFAPLAYGAIAVPLFFVISGYCIHRSFIATLQARPGHELRWSDYIIRRVWRIYPVLIGVILITFLLDQYTLEHYPQDTNIGSVSLRTMFINLFALQGVAGPYFGSDGPLWSLAVEIQLYALYPIIFYLVRRRGMKSCLLLTLAVSLACIALGLLPEFRPYLWFGPYWFCWTLGCAVAHLEITGVHFSLKRYQWGIWFLISACGFALWLGRYSTFAYSCAACFWAVILLRCLQGRTARIPARPLAWLANLGVISYSLYAVHVPVCVFVRSFFFEGAQSRNMLAIFPAMAVCILFAWGLFLLVERHSLRVPDWLRNLSGLNRRQKKSP